MDDQVRKRCIDILKATPAKLKAATKGVPKAVLTWTPAPGKWSILEIVCHLRDMERDAYLTRYRRILSEDNPTLPDIDGDLYALENDYRSQRLGDAVREWSRLRRECLKVLSGARGADWDRAGVHETAGPLSLLDLLKRQAFGNDEAHLGQIDAIRRRHESLARIAATPERLKKALKAFSPDALRRPPEPGKWSAIEIACHLRDVDQLFVERVTKAAFSDRPAFWMMDNDVVADKLGYRDADPTTVLKEYRRRREDLASLLRSLPHGVWRRTGIHPKRGEIAIEELVEVLAKHDDEHLSQIEALQRA
jgi:DinB superfamily